MKKWLEKTRGGYEYEIFKEDGNYIWGRIKVYTGTTTHGAWCSARWYTATGKHIGGFNNYDLMEPEATKVVRYTVIHGVSSGLPSYQYLYPEENIRSDEVQIKITHQEGKRPLIEIYDQT